MGFFDGGVVATDACLAIEGADDFLSGVLTGRMHMDWLRIVGGRLKSDYRYSKDLVYNNFVMPRVSADRRTNSGEKGRRRSRAVRSRCASHQAQTVPIAGRS